ncbi:DUF4340 domain-containing protein [Paenibacillus sp. WQ 127069]|uniref:DUF4340 domain-containing protein n=1 Tax=Paenibacillus baimaensis TaxID=2982185 RepID=A0ABT2UE61_9BACL|nr:DUF4340 domain-containing protein [Paenibacillus sp. WQ 127069]MCU6792895.1 DUF4340 domain-containing protein [Paenibacillus sp. WQ 127069]
MKRLIPTLILVILCIGGFWYAQSKDFFKEKPEPSVALATINKDEVASYSIKNGDNEIEMQRKDGNWTMTKPSPLPLDKFSADGWVESFISLSKDKTVDANAADLAPFGLAKPAQQFKVTLQNGTVHMLSVGDPVAIQGFHYAMFSGSPEVFQLSDTKTQPLTLSQIDFMDKNPVKLDYEQLRAMTVDWKGQKWTLTKVDADKKSYESDWKLGEQTLKAADATQVIDKLQMLSTEQPAKRTAEIKLDAPELRVEVKLVDAAKKETTEVYLGKQQQDTVWFSKEGSEWAYALPAASIQELADKGNPPAPPAQTEGQPTTEQPKAAQ